MNTVRKFKLDYSNDEHVALVKAMGSKNKTVAAQAQEVFAAFVGPIVSELLSVQGTASMIYSDIPFNEDDDPSFPLDLYFEADEDHVSVWSQSMAGGLPTSQVHGMSELKFSTYPLYSAVSMLGKYARKARLDVVAAAVNRMSQEVLVAQERNAWLVILKALADASTYNPDTKTSSDHLITSRTESVFVLDDLSVLITLAKRINAAWTGGTPVASEGRGITDLIVSPEIKEQIRGFAYNPMNVNNPAGGSAGATQDGIALDDQTRREIFMSAGREELFGINIIDMNEFGTQRRYNVLFGEFVAGNVAHGSTTFNTTDDEILVGIDLTKDAFVRPVARDPESNSTFTAIPDDQFNSRQDKIGWYGTLEEGRVCLNGRAVTGIIV